MYKKKHLCEHCVHLKLTSKYFGFCKIPGFTTYRIDNNQVVVQCDGYRQLEEWERNKNEC